MAVIFRAAPLKPGLASRLNAAVSAAASNCGAPGSSSQAPPPGSARSLFMDQVHQSDGESSELRVYRAPVPGLGSNDDLQRDSEDEDDRCSKDQERLPITGARNHHRKDGNHD